MNRGDNYDFANYTEERKDELVKGIIFMQDFFKKEFDLNLYVDFGTLLGAIRDKDFIPYDTDIDMTYLSKYSVKEDINKRADHIYSVIEKNGLLLYDFRKRTVNPHSGQVHVSLPQFNMIVDITTGWIDPYGDYYVFPYGKIGKREDVLPIKKVAFRKELVNVPNNSEKLLEFLYNDWRKPIDRGDGLSREGFKREWNYKLLAIPLLLSCNEIMSFIGGYI
jgi:hypothetical protein